MGEQASGEREYGEFKYELLFYAAGDVQGVYEAWWSANSWYPLRPISERLVIAERAVRELLAERLITLVRDPMEGADDIIPRSRHDEALRSWDAWVIGSEGIKVGYAITDAGLRALREVGEAKRIP
jgi:hypothetical protein